MEDRIAAQIARELAETNDLLRDIQREVVDIRTALRLQRMLQVANRTDQDPVARPPAGLKRQA